jgi:tRNA U34 5-carboxymethylaminomethyl modifying GTPase MnmE/TrmE
MALLNDAHAALLRANETLSGPSHASEEFVLADLQEAAGALQEVTGRRTTDDLLTHIFSRFCIGK